jgi:diguanylate cyclase (GGDEF)-like protein
LPPPPDPSFRDGPTGLSNRRHFDIIFDFAFHVADRGVPVTLALIALDGFAEFREREGAERGEEALREFARGVAATTRITDLSARFSDERFVAMLVDCNVQGGLIYADRLRDGAREFSEATGLTVSAGIATYRKEMGAPEDLLAVAEATIAAALKGGGDRVVLPSDLERDRV